MTPGDIAMNFDQIINRIGTSSLKWDSDPRYVSGDILPMWVADMDFPVPDGVSAALEKRAAHPIYGYTYDSGSFQQLTRSWLYRHHGWDVETDWVEFSPSVLTSLAMFLNTATTPGQSVIIMSPVYYPFSQFILNNGRRVEDCPLLNDSGRYTIDFARLKESAQKPNTAAMILCNPHNPVGRVFTHDELAQVAEICMNAGLKVFSDEIHADLIMPGNKHIPFASLSKEIAEITVTGYSPTKPFNLAGLQASSVVIPNETMRNAVLHQREAWGLSNINTFALEAYCAAYATGDEYLQELCQYLAKNRDYAAAFIQEEIPELKISNLEGTYLMWLDCSSLSLSSADLDVFFQNKARLSLDSGSWFGPGGEGYMRLNIACPRPVLETALLQLKQAIRLQIYNKGCKNE